MNVLPRAGNRWVGGFGGGGAAGGRPSNAPSLVTPRLANAVYWLEDFHATTIGNAGFASGLTGTPDTLVNLGPLGNPAWIATETAGSAGTVGLAHDSNAPGRGTCNVQTGTSANDTLMVDWAGRLTTSGLSFWKTGANQVTSIASAIFCMNGTTTSSIRGFGFVSYGAVRGTDWITDPDTTLAPATVAPSIVVTRHSAAYSGDTAGNVILRIYAGAAGAENTSVDLTALTGVAFSSSTYYKLEVYFNGATATWQVYWQGLLAATLTTAEDLSSGAPFRPSFGASTLTTAVRQISADLFYLETAQTTAR